MRNLFFILITVFIFFQNNGLAQTTASKAHADSFQMLTKKEDSLTAKRSYDSALYYTNLLEVFSKKDSGDISVHHAGILYDLGETCRHLNNFTLALHYFNDSYSIMERLTTPIDSLGKYVKTLVRLGYTNWILGAASQSIPCFEKAIGIYKRADSITKYVQINVYLAEVYSELGEYEKSTSINKLMISTLETLPQNEYNLYQLGAMYNNIATTYSLIDNRIKAIFYLKKSVEIEFISKQKGYTNDYEVIMLNLADLYAAYKINIDSALKICRQIEDSITPQNKAVYADLLKVKATLYQEQSKFTEAIDLFRQYKVVMDSLPEKADQYHLPILNLGLLYTATKQYEKADSLFRNEIFYFNQSGLQYSYAKQQAIIGLGKNLIAEKKYDEATDSLSMICQVTFTAMDKNFTGMSESEKIKYENELNDIFDLIYTCLYSNHHISHRTLDEIYNLELKRKAWIINSEAQILKQARNIHDTAFVTVYNGWINNRQMTAKQYSLPYTARSLDTDSLERINEEIAKKISLYIYQPTKDTAHNKALNSNTANLEFVRFTYKTGDDTKDSSCYAAFITSSSDTVPTFLHLGSEAALLQLLKNKKHEWINEDQLTLSLYSNNPVAKKLYNLVWKPLEEQLKNIKIINYSSSGLLNNISLPAINNGKENLVNRYIFRCFYSLNDAVKSNNTAYTKPNSFIAWSGMDYDTATYSDSEHLTESVDLNTSFSFQPGIRSTSPSSIKGISREPLQPINTNEIAELKKLFGNNKIAVASYEKGNATEEKFKNTAPGVNGVLHISTHGFYTHQDSSKIQSALPGEFISGIQDPLFRCGLAFSGVNYYWVKGRSLQNHDDGFLTGYEISQLDLHRVQLVTLSACETGLGDVTDNEGNLGLQRAFKMAGVNTMLVSLWEVPAKQTAELLSLFYKNWLGGQSLSASLRNAQVAMAAKKYLPYSWAGFVLIE